MSKDRPYAFTCPTCHKTWTFVNEETRDQAAEQHENQTQHEVDLERDDS